MSANQPTTDQSTTDSIETLTRRFRWRIIPTTLFALLAAFGTLGMMAQLAEVVYYNSKYGWIEPQSEPSPLNNLAVTSRNIFTWLFAGSSYLLAGVAADLWYRGRWRFAWLVTSLFFALIFISKWLDSL